MQTAKTDLLRVVQVSDTHLSESHAWFTANWPIFVDAMRNDPPELIVTSGDLSFNGPANPEDLAFAARCHAALPVPWRAIPGNHDTGEAPIASRLSQPITDTRLAAWRQHVGPSWWVQDLNRGVVRLRLIGLETALMGSNHSDEAAQVAFLEDALQTRDGRAVMVFVHMPPFLGDPDDSAISTQCILPEPRRWLLDRCAAGGVLAIAAGHIHQHTVTAYLGMQIVTAPATSFVNAGFSSPADLYATRTGYLRWTFDGEALRHEVVRPRLFQSVDMSNWTEAAKTTTNLPQRHLGAPMFCFPQPRTDPMPHPIAVLVICDGNRPDFVTDDTTPNMAALRRAGVWGAAHKGIFPSATRASSASIATGSHPVSHGLRGNAVALPIEGGFAFHDAGKPEFLDTYRSHFGRGLLRPALAERVASRPGSGLHGAIIGSNVSPGAAFFHDGESHAHMIHRHLSYTPGRVPVDPAPAAPGIKGDTAVTTRFIDMLLERRPSTATLWLSEPDVSMHAAPLGSPVHLEALKQADALVGKVAEAVERLRDAGHDVLLIVGSDHGHESISDVIPVERRLFEAGFKSSLEASDLMVVPQGGSAFIHFVGDALTRRAEVADWLSQQPWVSEVFQGEALAELGQIPGDDLLAIDMAKSSERNVNGVPGLSVLATRFSQDEEESRLHCGMHGGRGPYETSPVLLAVGRGFATSGVIEQTTCIVDLAPSMLHHLGMAADNLDGSALQDRGRAGGH